jgi:hypothetical protein
MEVDFISMFIFIEDCYFYRFSGKRNKHNIYKKDIMRTEEIEAVGGIERNGQAEGEIAENRIKCCTERPTYGAPSRFKVRDRRAEQHGKGGLLGHSKERAHGYLGAYSLLCRRVIPRLIGKSK